MPDTILATFLLEWNSRIEFCKFLEIQSIISTNRHCLTFGCQSGTRIHEKTLLRFAPGATPRCPGVRLGCYGDMINCDVIKIKPVIKIKRFYEIELYLESHGRSFQVLIASISDAARSKKKGWAASNPHLFNASEIWLDLILCFKSKRIKINDIIGYTKLWFSKNWTRRYNLPKMALILNNIKIFFETVPPIGWARQ